MVSKSEGIVILASTAILPRFSRSLGMPLKLERDNDMSDHLTLHRSSYLASRVVNGVEGAVMSGDLGIFVKQRVEEF